jgi:hypothetical protein
LKTAGHGKGGTKKDKKIAASLKRHAIIEQSDFIVPLFHPGSAAVSSDAVDPDNSGYRLFTIGYTLGETVPEKLDYISIWAMSLSISRHPISFTLLH